jgi:hypothetical protein
MEDCPYLSNLSLSGKILGHGDPPMQAIRYEGASPTLTTRAHLMTAEKPPSEAGDLRSRVGTLLVLLLNVVVDLLFLTGWTFANHYGEILLAEWHVHDQYSYNVLLWSFRVSTLVPIVAFVFVDLIRIVRRIWREGQESPGGSARNA